MKVTCGEWQRQFSTSGSVRVNKTDNEWNADKKYQIKQMCTNGFYKHRYTTHYYQKLEGGAEEQIQHYDHAKQ